MLYLAKAQIIRRELTETFVHFHIVVIMPFALPAVKYLHNTEYGHCSGL